MVWVGKRYLDLEGDEGALLLENGQPLALEDVPDDPVAVTDALVLEDGTELGLESD